MEKNYDVIVIGAGNGGLMGALTLCREGKRVLLVEKHNVPGGCGTTFRRGRFEFEAALHQLYGMTPNPDGSMGLLARQFEELGLSDKVEFVTQQEAFRMIAGNVMDITLPGGHDSFVEQLCKIAPDEADSIRAYQKLCDCMAEEVYRLYSVLADNGPIHAEAFPMLFDIGTVLARDIMSQYLKHPVVKAVYTVLYSYLGLPIERATFMALGALYARGEGTSYVKGGSQAMSTAMAEGITEHGGTILYNTTVKKILVEDGAVQGILTEDGARYEAPVVLCGNNRLNAYVDMIDEKLVPETTFDDLRVSTPSQSTFGLFLGLDITAEEAGITCATNFLAPDPKASDTRYDINQRQYDSVFRMLMSCYSIEDPGCCPEGTAVISIITPKSPDFWAELPPEHYHEEKIKYAEKCLEFLYQYFPKIRGHIEEVEAFTPLTLMRYIHTPRGAYYGVDANIKDLIANKLDLDSPIKGLYFGGANVMLGGFNTTMMAGHAAGKRILNDMEQGGKQA